MSAPARLDAAARVRAWRHDRHRALADEVEPWEHGTILRSARFPNVFVLNMVRVEEAPALDAAQLAWFADGALAGMAHRRLEFDRAGDGEPLRGDLHRLGWETERDVWLRHVGPAPAMPPCAEEVPWRAANPLRMSWHLEDRPGDRDFGYLEEWERANAALDVRVFAIREGGDPVAFSALDRAGDSAEVGPVYVRADRRGRGLGAEVVRAALAAAAPLGGDVWIAADDEGRPRRLYERLGFEPVCTTLEAMLWPAS
jgi:GNAT superfamily N-acetyltransferase